jgi:transitional endoplasmic reticulum ATPase
MTILTTVTVGSGLLQRSGQGIAFLDPEVMEVHAIVPDEIIKIASHSGKFVLAKAAPLPTEEGGKGNAHLDHYLRRVIKVAPGETVNIEKIITQPVKRVFLMTASSLPIPTGELKEQLRKYLFSERIPVSLGSILSLPQLHSSAKAIFKVSEITPGPGLVDDQTEVEVIESLESPRDEHGHGHEHEPSPISDVVYEDVGGLGKEITMVKELVEIPLRYPQVYEHLGISVPRGIIFHGPAGVGKTHLALAVANEVKAELFYINGPEIISTEFGETESNLRQIFRKASEHRPAIIVIDEMDAIAPKRSETGSFTTTRTVSYLLSLMDGLKKAEGIIVIGTTNSIDSIDTAARRPGRFDREIYLSPPDTAARLEILRIHSRGIPLTQESVDYFEEVAHKTIGFVGADLMELCREAGLNAFRRHPRSGAGEPSLMVLETLVVEKEDFDYALGKIQPSAMREVMATASDVGWDDIGGLEEAKDQLRRLVQMPLLHPDVLKSMRVHPPVGVILFGEPGTGKTLLAKALAKECQASFIYVKGSEIFSKWYGESEAEIHSIFQLAYRVAPAIVFFDQFDAIAPRRGRDPSGMAGERVVSQLLNEMDSIPHGSRLVVVAATNRLDLVDPAFLQANRFGIQVPTTMPDKKARKEILQGYLGDVPLAEVTHLEEMAEMIAGSTDGFSGADLAALCQRSKLLALQSGRFERSVMVTWKHVQETLKEMVAGRVKSSIP